MKKKEEKREIIFDENAKKEFLELKKILHEHPSKSFIQLATEALEEGEMEDSNLFLETVVFQVRVGEQHTETILAQSFPFHPRLSQQLLELGRQRAILFHLNNH